MAVTIKDVARVAGVSPATVCRALSTPDLVRAETGDRVRRAAAELGYSPNRAARGLITGRTGNLGLIVPDLGNPFFPGVVKGIQARAREADYAVFLADTDEDPAAEVQLVRALAKQVDGIVLCSPRMSEAELRDVAAQTPLVMLNRRVGRIPAVTFANHDGMRQAVIHLTALGTGGSPTSRVRGRPGPTGNGSADCAPSARRPGPSWSRSARSSRSSTAGWRPPTRCSPPASPRSSPTTTSSRWACSAASPRAASRCPPRSA
jgi:hypothetical protein